MKIMKGLEDFYRLKDGYSAPTRYLGATVKRWHFQDDLSKTKWALSSSQYVKKATHNIEFHLSQSDRKLYATHQPLPSNYLPETNITPYLNDAMTNFYQSQISILRWMIQLGRLYIYIQNSLLSAYLAQPREGHLKAVYHIFSYLKAHGRSKIGQTSVVKSKKTSHVTPLNRMVCPCKSTLSLMQTMCKTRSLVGLVPEFRSIRKRHQLFGSQKYKDQLKHQPLVRNTLPLQLELSLANLFDTRIQQYHHQPCKRNIIQYVIISAVKWLQPNVFVLLISLQAKI
jgi:hypothetical protein